MNWQSILFYSLLLVLGGCAAWQPVPVPRYQASDAETAACARFYEAFDRQVDAAGVNDVQDARIGGFPHLRSSRFLASFRDDPVADRFPDWLVRLRRLGAEGESVELANLPSDKATWQALDVAGRAAAADRLAECGDRLLAADRDNPAALAMLQERARVADAYHDYQRVLGLYPLTALAVAAGVAELQASITADFAAASLPVRGELVDYVPADAETASIRDWYSDLSVDALGIPVLSATQRQQLFQRFAPIWRIDVAGPADRIGKPFWQGGAIEVDTSQPVVYEKLSHTRWRGQILLQLNYVMWLPARPLTGMFDLLGGHLDGVTWRVTLNPDGTPLLYDAMHNCGCYHMAFPRRQLSPRNVGGLWQEPLITPALAPVLQDNQRMRIRLQQGTHYLQRIEAVVAEGAGIEYATANYISLRSLPVSGNQRRSLFNEEGLVTGSERLERWLLWPMGVPEPGAMRQWGRHATAFVGKRHFDDPDLLQRYFRAE